METVLCAAVGTASHQNGLAACTVYGTVLCAAVGTASHQTVLCAAVGTASHQTVLCAAVGTARGVGFNCCCAISWGGGIFINFV